MSEKKTLKQLALENPEFMKKYEDAGLPNKRNIVHNAKGKGKRKDDTHANVSPARQYSKYLRHMGLVYKSVSE